MPECEIREMEQKDIMSVRITTAVQNLPGEFGKGYAEIMEYFCEAGIQPIGPPVAIYYNMDMQNLDVEMGFPVMESKEGKGRIKAGIIPAGKYAVTLHEGPYQEIERTYNLLFGYLKENGFEAGTFCVEEYLNDPREVPPEQLQTNVYFMVK